MNPDAFMVDLADRGENPAEAPYNCYIEIDKDERKAIIVWVENLQFHAEFNGRRAWTDDDNWKPLVTENGWLKTDVEQRLATRLTELIRSQANVYVDPVEIVEYAEDEPNICFEIATGYTASETYEHWMDRIGWPIVATLINVTDPGTFNSAYLFDMETVK